MPDPLKPGGVALPPVLVADEPAGAPASIAAPLGGILLRDLDLEALVERVAHRDVTLAVDLDSIRGIAADEAAADFLTDVLGVPIVMTRRPQVAARVSARGGLGLLHVLAFDSTGVSRTLESLPRAAVGSVVSPGPVLMHMHPVERERLPRPLVAYGLITRTSEALACLELADAVVLRPDLAARTLAVRATPARTPVRKPLTTLTAPE